MVRPGSRAWLDRGLLLPGEPCPGCGGLVVERLPEAGGGETYGRLAVQRVRECLAIESLAESASAAELTGGCGARVVKLTANVGTANLARLYLAGVLNYARTRGGVVFGDGQNPAGLCRPRKILSAVGDKPRPTVKREKVALSALDVEMLRAYVPTLAHVYAFELLYYGLHRPGDLDVARFGNLERTLANPLTGLWLWQLQFQRQKMLEHREASGRETDGLVTLAPIVAAGLLRIQELLGVRAEDRVMDPVGLPPRGFSRLIGVVGRGIEVPSACGYNGRLTVACLRLRAGDEETIVAKECDNTPKVLLEHYREAGYRSASFGPAKEVGELVAIHRPEAEAAALTDLRGQATSLQAEIRLLGEAVLALKATRVTQRDAATALGVGLVTAISLLAAVTDDPMQAGLVPRHSNVPPPAERLERIRGHISWLETHGIANNPYPTP